jgi:hypothetical protein
MRHRGGLSYTEPYGSVYNARRGGMQGEAERARSRPPSPQIDPISRCRFDRLGDPQALGPPAPRQRFCRSACRIPHATRSRAYGRSPLHCPCHFPRRPEPHRRLVRRDPWRRQRHSSRDHPGHCGWWPRGRGRFTAGRPAPGRRGAAGSYGAARHQCGIATGRHLCVHRG